MLFNMRTLSRYIVTPQPGSSRGVATCLNPGRHAKGVQQVGGPGASPEILFLILPSKTPFPAFLRLEKCL